MHVLVQKSAIIAILIYMDITTATPSNPDQAKLV